MKKTIILGIDGWYPQVDGGTNVVKNYREHLRGEFGCEIVAPSYGKKFDEEGEKRYCGGVFHNFSLGVRFFSFRKERMVTASRLQNHPAQKALNPQ